MEINEIGDITPEDYVLSAGIDYLTVTTYDKKTAMGWYRMYQEYKELLAKEHGNPGEKKWKALGYDGLSLEGIRMGGDGKEGVIVILSGETSKDLWKQFLPATGNVTRIDLAVTVTIGFEFKDLARKYYEGVGEQEETNRSYSLIQNSKGGQTLYVGSRSSDQFGRVYDKGVQSGVYQEGFKWRYEVEYKKPRAQGVAKALSSFETQDANKLIAEVHNWFDYRGIKPIFRSSGDGIRIQLEAKVTTDDKKLNWLRTQVKPSIEYLLSRGRGTEALVAIGLVDFDLGAYEAGLSEDSDKFDKSQDEG